jgi:hypothetical protein
VQQDGLDVSSPDQISSVEVQAYRDHYVGTGKGLLDSYEFWLEFRPDVLKRHKARTRHYGAIAEPRYPCVGLLGALHQYAVGDFAEGVGYEMRMARAEGATRSDVLDTLSVAFIHSGHPGMYAAAKFSDYLREWEDAPGQDGRFPDGWELDPDALDSGMDYANPEPTAQDMRQLRDWYMDTLGELPRYVTFLMRHRPGLLKAYRDRYEHAIRDSLPKQMLPYMLLNYNVVRGFGEGIRENVLLGRALGMSDDQLLQAISFGVLHAGANALGIVEQAAGDLLPDTAPDLQ